MRINLLSFQLSVERVYVILILNPIIHGFHDFYEYSINRTGSFLMHLTLPGGPSSIHSKIRTC